MKTDLNQIDQFISIFYKKKKYTISDIEDQIKLMTRDNEITEFELYTELLEESTRNPVLQNKKNLLSSTLSLLNPKVYFLYKLYKDNELIYIGQSFNLKGRLDSHKVDKDFTKVEIYMCKYDEDVDKLENSLILKYRPPLNKRLDLDKIINLDGNEPIFEPLEEATFYFHPIAYLVKDNEDRSKYLYHYEHNLGVLNTKSIVPFWVNKHIDTPVDKNKSLYTLIDEAGLSKYLQLDSPTEGVHTFAGQYLFTNRKWRQVSRNTWYKRGVDNTELFNIFKRYADGTFLEVDENPVFTFGKHKGEFVKDITETDPAYIEWCIGNIEQEKLYKLGLCTHKDVCEIFPDKEYRKWKRYMIDWGFSSLSKALDHWAKYQRTVDETSDEWFRQKLEIMEKVKL